MCALHRAVFGLLHTTFSITFRTKKSPDFDASPIVTHSDPDLILTFLCVNLLSATENVDGCCRAASSAETEPLLDDRVCHC
jgi:hypothetical protein